MQKKLLALVLGVLLLGTTACQDKPTPQAEATEMISLYVAESGETKELPLEEYLYGVVAAEMDVNWPREALAAQAVLARTFTLEKIAQGGVEARGTDASTDVEEFQAYDAQKINDNVKQAVDETTGEVVTYQGELIKAWFFADGGGITAASAAEGLAYDKEETPYIHSVADPGAELPDNENHAWQASFTLEEVNAALAQIGFESLRALEDAGLGELGESGRALNVQINGQAVPAVALRLALGSEKMKSTLLDAVSVQSGQLSFSGRGYGHGVGMSQWGARALAEQGKDYSEIIRYFFRDIEIEKHK